MSVRCLLNLGVYSLMAGIPGAGADRDLGSLVTILGMLIFAIIVYTKV